MKKSLCKYALIWLVIPILAWYISGNWFQLMLIQGDSMAPAYHNLQLVLIDKRECDYTYGDVVAFYCEGLSCVLVKRVSACPGDTVVIRENLLYVNEQESQLFGGKAFFREAGALAEPVKLGSDQYIVLGDNIEKSVDSRSHEVGAVSKRDIMGRILK